MNIRSPVFEPGRKNITETVLQGEFKISDNPNVMMSTLLGSCIAACIWDPKAKVGGMNHFLLADGKGSGDGDLGFGVNAMELLLNGLISRGATRENLMVRLFGGAKMFAGRQNIGEQNAEFAKWFVENEGLECASICVGGLRGRKIRFWPASGQAQRMFMDDTLSVDEPVAVVSKSMATSSDKESGDVELF
ncbi:chemotaxis protein CheD [Aestuariibius sp. HNIBRBA575]|uniref:chemotaxis protein CheD n=1 Tax=Aestuariibius sp. HNIBRBA575 TaxID=3233343 RepID=UPI0034A11C1F